MQFFNSIHSTLNYVQQIIILQGQSKLDVNFATHLFIFENKHLALFFIFFPKLNDFYLFVFFLVFWTMVRSRKIFCKFRAGQKMHVRWLHNFWKRHFEGIKSGHKYKVSCKWFWRSKNLILLFVCRTHTKGSIEGNARPAGSPDEGKLLVNFPRRGGNENLTDFMTCTYIWTVGFR